MNHYNLSNSLIHTYEKYRRIINGRGRKVLREGFGKLPIEIQNDIKEKYEQKINYSLNTK